MDNATIIHDLIEQVFSLRASARADDKLGSAVAQVKRVQASRFQSLYSDLMQSAKFGPACRFFLEELYSDADFSDRDMQFARIAKTLTTLFPASVVRTAVALAQLHALTEELDHCMAQQLLAERGRAATSAEAYLAAWTAVGRQPDRLRQVEIVLLIGRQLTELTRKPGLATMLKLMRKPAASAGLASLQLFLERGFAIFADMSRSKGLALEFLSTIQTRESAWIADMFDDPCSLCLVHL